MFVLRQFFITLIVVVVCSAKRRPSDESSEEVSPNCDDGLAAFGLATPCSTTTTTTTTTTTAKPEPNWCRLNNGTTLALGYTFIYRNCTLCECTRFKTVRCQPLQCLPTYCVDGSKPGRRPGTCCGQCSTDTSSDTCLYNGIDYPHGTVMKSIEGKMQCWCQWGRIECRQYITSLFGGFDVFADSATMMLMAMIFIIVLGFGVLVCCSFSLIIYFYFRRHQETFQQAYDQYVNSMGWQPMEEEEYYEGSEEKSSEFVDAAQQKQYEAEQNEYVVEQIPPPYAIFEETNSNEEKNHAE